MSNLFTLTRLIDGKKTAINETQLVHMLGRVYDVGSSDNATADTIESQQYVVDGGELGFDYRGTAYTVVIVPTGERGTPCATNAITFAQRAAVHISGFRTART